MVSTIEGLQKIVADENRPAEEREAAAKHILALQGQPAEPPKTRESFQEIFDRLLNNDSAIEAKNKISKCCPRCYTVQPIANESCALCGPTTKAWLPAEEEVPEGAEIDSYYERRMFKNMSANYSAADLKIALRSGWAVTAERERVASLLLSLRDATQKHQPIEIAEGTAATDVDADIRDAKKYYRLQQMKLDAELAALRS